jgi:hypothetical protein
MSTFQHGGMHNYENFVHATGWKEYVGLAFLYLFQVIFILLALSHRMGWRAWWRLPLSGVRAPVLPRGGHSMSI